MPNPHVFTGDPLKDYPSVKWKLINLSKLAKQNMQKLQEEADKLKCVLY